MKAIAPPLISSPPLRLNFHRTLVEGTVLQSALSSERLESVATIKLDNAKFEPNDGLCFSSVGCVACIAFPDPSTLVLAIRPRSPGVAQGKPVAFFVPCEVTLKNLTVVFNRQTDLALAGEMVHTKGLGNLAYEVAGSHDGGVLQLKDKSRPFALKNPHPFPIVQSGD